MYEAKILADSVADNVRLVTLAVTFPRIVLSEQNTHRVLSKNTASSRAIPVKTRCDAIEANPFIPESFGKNKKGMQSDELLDAAANAEAEAIWREALADALKHARRLAALNVHKQYANRLTEPFSWVTQIVSGTCWNNYLNLRTHKDAQPEIQKAAHLIKAAMASHKPIVKKPGEWHLPLVHETSVDIATAVKISVVRCAAVSYEKHGVQKTVEEELARHDAMLASGHMSPFEHQARVGYPHEYSNHRVLGNYRAPWLQYRKQLPNEDVFQISMM
jgi:hypothetical protein